jgi:hypothetical protein
LGGCSVEADLSKKSGVVPAWRETLAWRRTDDRNDTHIAIQEALDGKVVDWMEHVSDEQYRAR